MKLVIACLLLLPALAWGEEWPLKQVFGVNRVGLVQTSVTATAELCVDDGCKRLVLDGTDTLPIVHDFAFLYFALVENYDIEQAKSPADERYFAAIVQRRKGNCTGPDEEAIARCTLAAMAKRYPIKGYASKMDEGWNRPAAWDIQTEMRRAKIIP